MKKLLNIIGISLLSLLMAATLFTYIAPHFAWRVDMVSSGSMAPALETGSLVVAIPVKQKAIEIGDIIIFRLPNVDKPVCHRVIGVNRETFEFLTKGDAQAEADPFTVPASNILGKMIIHVPSLGHAVQFLLTFPGFLLGLVAPALVILWKFSMGIQREIDGKSRRPAVKAK